MPHACVHVHKLVHPSIHPSICHLQYLSVHRRCIYLSSYLPNLILFIIYLSVCRSIYLPNYPFILRSINLLCLPTILSVFLPISIYPSISIYSSTRNSTCPRCSDFLIERRPRKSTRKRLFAIGLGRKLLHPGDILAPEKETKKNA